MDRFLGPCGPGPFPGSIGLAQAEHWRLINAQRIEIPDQCLNLYVLRPNQGRSGGERDKQERSSRHDDFPSAVRPAHGAFDKAGAAREDRAIGEKALEIGSELGGARVPARGILGHRLHDDRLEVARNRRIEPARRSRLVKRDLTHHFLVIAPVVGGAQGQ